MSRKREAGRRWSRDGKIRSTAAYHVHVAVSKRGAERWDAERKAWVRNDSPLPHPDDIRAVLKLALITLDVTNPTREEPFRPDMLLRPEVLFVTAALKRHLENGKSLEQAFGYRQAGRGAPRIDESRAQMIACAVFEERFIKGRNADVAGCAAGRRFGVSKTQALAALAQYKVYALLTLKAQRIKAGRKPLWTPAEQQRLERYFGSDTKRSQQGAEQPE